jgi:hypothetical protein
MAHRVRNKEMLLFRLKAEGEQKVKKALKKGKIAKVGDIIPLMRGYIDTKRSSRLWEEEEFQQVVKEELLDIYLKLKDQVPSRKKAEQLLGEGMSPGDVAAKTGYTPQRIYMIRREMGLPPLVMGRPAKRDLGENDLEELAERMMNHIPANRVWRLLRKVATQSRVDAAQCRLGVDGKALSIFPKPFILDVETGTVRDLTWIELFNILLGRA